MHAFFTHALLLFVMLSTLLGGCATPVRKLKPADLPRLPKSEGFYGEKLYPSPSWIYEGSTARYHHFRYTYTRVNRLCALRVLVAKSDMPLTFEQLMEAVPEKGIKVTLGWDPAQGYHFIKLIPSSPKDFHWLTPPDTPPNFNQTLDLTPKTQVENLP